MQQCPDRRGRLVTSVPQVDHSVVQKAGKWHLEAKRLPDIRHLYLLVYVASGVCCANLADVNIVNPNRSTDWDDTAIAISLNEKRKFLRIGRQPEGALILLPLLRRHDGARVVMMLCRLRALLTGAFQPWTNRFNRRLGPFPLSQNEKR